MIFKDNHIGADRPSGSTSKSVCFGDCADSKINMQSHGCPATDENGGGNVPPLFDERRFENLKEMCHLVELLILEIDEVSHINKNRHEHSMKEMGEYAYKFLTNDLGIVVE